MELEEDARLESRRQDLWNSFLHCVQSEMRQYLVSRKRITEGLPECVDQYCKSAWSKILRNEGVGRRIRNEEQDTLQVLWDQEVELHTGSCQVTKREILMETEAIEAYLASKESIPKIQGKTASQEELREHLYDALIDRVLEIAANELTTIQYQILSLKLEGLTYEQIAQRRKVNYTAIAHAIGGIRVHTRGRTTKHGGIMKKLERVCKEDARCSILLEKLHELRG